MLSQDVRAVLAKITGISRVDFGSNKISSVGERRKITVYGTANTEFSLALNKFTDSKDSGTAATNYNDKKILSSTETSILSSQNKNDTIVAGDNITYDIIKQKIGSDGSYSFFQTFPKMTLINTTAVNGAKTTATNFITFDDVTGVETGDEVRIFGTTGVTISTVATLNSTTRVYLTDYITVADNAVAEFRRSTRYSINLLKSAQSPLYSMYSPTTFSVLTIL